MFDDEIMERDCEFKSYFGTSIRDFISTAPTKGDFDIVKFDDYMAEHKGYDIERDGSLRNFICKKYGVEAMRLVEELCRHFLQMYWMRGGCRD